MHLLKTNAVLNNLKKQSILKTTLYEIELPSCIWPICYSIYPQLFHFKLKTLILFLQA